MQVVFIVILLLLPTLVAAQPTPPCDSEDHRRLDFWIGQWRVTAKGKQAGQSIVRKELDGCLILENWYGDDGDRGKSLNWFDVAAKSWHQVYVGLTGVGVDFTGAWGDGAMRLESADSSVKMTLTPKGGALVQHLERKREGAWVVRSELQYQKASVQATEYSPKTGCDAPESRQFDFLVGSWNVYTPEDQSAGTNRIDKLLNGCLLMENWSGAKGGAGKSFNFFDTARKKWRQVWVSAQGALELSGDLIDGEMRYAGETTGLNGVTQESLVFTPQSDGSIRQLWRQSPDGGNTWRIVFEGIYRKR